LKVCVYGAGAIGGHIAGRLAQGGAEVSVVARGANLEAYRNHGLRVRLPDGEIQAKVRASSDPAELGRQDAVVVTVKAPSLSDVAAAIGPLLGPDTKVVFAMNGIPWFYFLGEGGPHAGMRLPKLDPGGALERAIGPERAIAGVVYSSCTVREPGMIEVENAPGRLVLAQGEAADRLAVPLRAGGLIVETTDRIHDAIWSKLLMNMSSGPLAILTGATPSGFYAEEGCREASRTILREGTAIAASLGCTVRPDVKSRLKNFSRSRHKASILQDLELGRPMEIEALYGVPLDLARLGGVPTPLLDILVAMVRVRAREAGLY